MSDTPRTDALLEFSEMERELEKYKGLYFTMREIDCVAVEKVEKLERENAALRTVLKRWLKVADDCHQEQQQVGYSEYNITVGLVCDTRALLDAARKEAQP